MQNSDLQIKVYPSYAKKDRRIGVIGALVFAMIYISSYLAETFGYEILAKALIAIGLIWMISILTWYFFYSIRIKCPECEKITKNTGCLENGNLSRVCENCNILWDLGRQPTKG